jgi:methylthioribose-1-phosphate isomerase
MPGERQSENMRTVWWEEDAEGEAVCMIDQSLLPQQTVILRLTHEEQVADAITTLKVRGAPAIGVTAAFGIVLSLYRLLREQGDGLTVSGVKMHLQAVSEMLSILPGPLIACSGVSMVRLMNALFRGN